MISNEWIKLTYHDVIDCSEFSRTARNVWCAVSNVILMPCWPLEHLLYKELPIFSLLRVNKQTSRGVSRETTSVQPIRERFIVCECKERSFSVGGLVPDRGSNEMVRHVTSFKRYKSFLTTQRWYNSICFSETRRRKEGENRVYKAGTRCIPEPSY